MHLINIIGKLLFFRVIKGFFQNNLKKLKRSAKISSNCIFARKTFLRNYKKLIKNQDGNPRNRLPNRPSHMDI